MNQHSPSDINYELLKTRHRELREDFDEDFSIRLHRALSWLERAELETNDADAGFIFYWISFNADYSIDQSSDERLSEGQRFRDYFTLLIACDADNQIYSLVWQRFTQEIRSILNNEFIFANFWLEDKTITPISWRDKFEESKLVVQKALTAKNTIVILQILFSRLYVLRNQLIHGNATWGGRVNRQQVKDSYRLISNLQPLFLSIMMDNPCEDWGALAFPIIKLD